MDLFSGWCKSGRTLDDITAIVTGGNTGIGKETVRDLYKRGATVILACRDVKKGEIAKRDIIDHCQESKGTVIIEEIDLSKLSSVREFCSKVLKNHEKIHILVNNAGVMMCPYGRTDDGFETHIGTNHFGHALLTMLLLPRLRKSAPARIVTLSSYLHAKYPLNLDDINFNNTTYDALKAYCWSKAANVLFSAALAEKLQERGISDVTTYCVHPGVVSTEISRHFSSTYWPGATWVFDNLLSWFMKTPRCGAQTTLYCAVDEACAEQSGLYYRDCKVSPPSAECRKKESRDKMWVNTLNALPLGTYDPFGFEDPPNTY